MCDPKCKILIQDIICSIILERPTQQSQFCSHMSKSDDGKYSSKQSNIYDKYAHICINFLRAVFKFIKADVSKKNRGKAANDLGPVCEYVPCPSDHQCIQEECQMNILTLITGQQTACPNASHHWR